MLLRIALPLVLVPSIAAAMQQAAAAQAAEPVGAQSAITIGLMITIMGATAWLTRALTKGEQEMKRLNEQLLEVRGAITELKAIPERITRVEDHVQNLEIDLNNLWAEWRKLTVATIDDHDRTRRERGTR